MTTYTALENQIVEVIRIHEDWDEENVSQGDFRIIDAGLDHFLVLTPGISEHLRANQQDTQRLYTTNIDFGIRVSGEEVLAWKTFKTKRDNLFIHIENYPTLNDFATVHQVRIATQGDPIGIPIDAENPDSELSHIWQEIQIIVNLNYVLTGGEYA